MRTEFSDAVALRGWYKVHFNHLQIINSTVNGKSLNRPFELLPNLLPTRQFVKSMVAETIRLPVRGLETETHLSANNKR